MVIVLIKWKIKPEQESTFLTYWRQDATVTDRTGLIGEFLSEVGSEPYITWELAEPNTPAHPPHKVFVNIGIWADADTFHEQIGQYFNDKKPIEPFEAARRVRTVVHPTCRRMGSAALPGGDTEGVR